MPDLSSLRSQRGQGHGRLRTTIPRSRARSLGHSHRTAKGKLVLKLKRTENFDMTNPAFPTLDGASRSAAEASLEFGRFRVLLRQRQLLADGLPVELGTRAFELLLALLEANGSLVSKEQLLARVWPGTAVADANVKVHVCALRKALGEDRDFIRTEFGLGYRFTAAVRSTVAWSACWRPMRRQQQSTAGLFPQRITRFAIGRAVPRGRRIGNQPVVERRSAPLAAATAGMEQRTHDTPTIRRRRAIRRPFAGHHLCLTLGSLNGR